MNKLIVLMSACLALTSCKESNYEKGESGKQGPQGPQGTQGVPGVPGLQGEKGTNGFSIYSMVGAPSNELGKNGDSYINSATGDLYLKINDEWVFQSNIRGPKGDKGDK